MMIKSDEMNRVFQTDVEFTVKNNTAVEFWKEEDGTVGFSTDDGNSTHTIVFSTEEFAAFKAWINK